MTDTIKKYFNYAVYGLCIVLILVGAFLCNRSKNYEQLYKAEQNLLTDSTKHFRDKQGRDEATKNVLIVTANQLKKDLHSRDSLFILLQKSVNSSTTSATTATTVTGGKETIKVDSVFVKGHDTCKTYSWHKLDRWEHLHGQVNCDTAVTNDSVFNEFSVVQKLSPDTLFKPRSWFNRHLIVTVTNENPNTFTQNIQSFALPTKKNKWYIYGLLGVGIGIVGTLYLHK